MLNISNISRLKFLFFIISTMLYADQVPVTDGGTGRVTLTPYAVLCGGTTSTGAVQSIASVGTLGQILTSNGAGALPTFQTQTPGLVFIATRTASASASLVFDSSEITSTYARYLVLIDSIVPETASTTLRMTWSTDNGSSYLAVNYQAGIVSYPYNSAAPTNSNSTSLCPLTGAATVVHSGYLMLFGLNGTSPFYVGNMMFGTTVAFADCVGRNTLSVNINNIKFAMSSGNITSGTISLYGFVS